MGNYTHHTIVVVGYRDEIAEIHKKACEIFEGSSPISPILDLYTSSRASFYVAPDGATDGREGSLIGDNKRADFVKWLRHQDRHLDIAWAETRFGTEEQIEVEVVNHNNPDRLL